MNIRKNMTISFALAALALGVTTTKASAQPVLKGSFELPGAVYFGDTLLQPGHYNISMSAEVRDLAYTQTIRVSGEGVSKTFLAISKPTPESGRNCLKITGIDGTYVVAAFDTGVSGQIVRVWHDQEGPEPSAARQRRPQHRGSGLYGRRFLMSGAWDGRPVLLAVRPPVAQPNVPAWVLPAIRPTELQPHRRGDPTRPNRAAISSVAAVGNGAMMNN